MSFSRYLIGKLEREPLFFGIWAGLAGFGSYFCMYMYRKPFTSALFEGQHLAGVDYKILLIVSQVIGYSLAKFLGIKFVSSIRTHYLTLSYLSLLGISLLALLFFSWSSPAWGLLWLFLNGLSLGMIYGIVFLYLEGRKITEILAVILCANFIITSGISKTIGQYLLVSGIVERSMPLMVGILFIPLTLLFAWMLSMIPPPGESDKAQRHLRAPMSGKQRSHILKEYKVLIFLFVCSYILLTMVRDVRDNFGVEIWKSLDYGNDPSIFTKAEIPVTLILLILLGMLYRIKDNQRALRINLWLSLAGFIILLLGTLAFQFNYFNGLVWMITTGTGLFIPYILYNGILFDRFIGAFRISANVGFFMYIVDAFGYLSSVIIMLYKNFMVHNLSWIKFYMILCLVGGVAGMIIILLTMRKTNLIISKNIDSLYNPEINQNEYVKL